MLRTPQTLIISLYAFGGFFPHASCRYVEHPRPIPGTASKSALRCEKIREYADTILQGDDEILLYVQDRIRRNEKRTTEREEFREKWAERRKPPGTLR